MSVSTSAHQESFYHPAFVNTDKISSPCIKSKLNNANIWCISSIPLPEGNMNKHKNDS